MIQIANFYEVLPTFVDLSLSNEIHFLDECSLPDISF